MKIDLDDKTDVLEYYKKLLAEALKEKEDLKTKFKKWQNSSKNLSKLLNTKMSANNKFRLGYVDYRYGNILSYENEVLQSVFMNKASGLEDTSINDRFADEMHVTSTDESYFKPNEYASCESDSSVETSTSMLKPIKNASKVVSEPKVWIDAPIIEKYESDNDNDSVSNVQEDKEKSSFAFTDSFKRDRNGHTRKGLGYAFTRKACFVCGSFSHLIRDGDFHEKRMAKQAESKNKVTGQIENRPVWNNVQRVNHQNKFVPSVLLTKTGKFLVNAARQNYSSQATSTSTASKVNIARPFVNETKLKRNFYKTHSPNKRPFHNTTAQRTTFSCQKVNAVGNKSLSAVGGNGDTAVKASTDDPHRALKHKGIVDSRCSMHMTRNKAHLADYHEFKGGSVAFRGSNGRISGKGHAWMFVLDYLTNSMNYEPVSLENQANKSAGPKEANNSTGTQANDDQCVHSEEINLNEEHFILPIWSAFSTTINSSRDKIEMNTCFKTCKKPNASTSSTNLINTASIPLSIGVPSRAFNDGELSYLDPSKYALLDDPSMPHLEDIYANLGKGIFTDSSYDNEGVVTDFNNLETTYALLDDPSMPHLEDIYANLGKGIFTDSSYDNEGVVTDFNNLETTKAIGTKWVYKNKKDEKGVLIRNKARLVAQGHRLHSLSNGCEECLHVTPKTSHIYVVKRIFRKSTTGGFQFHGMRLISWQCKKQTIVATSTTKAEYVATAHYCGQVLWIQNQLLDYGFNFMNTKIYIDNESIICIVKNPVFHSKTNHIKIRHHFIRDAYEKKSCSKELASPKQTNLGKDIPNPLMAGRRSNRRRIPNIVEPEICTIEEIISMADRTMEDLLQAPTEGDVLNDAIKIMLFPYSLEDKARILYEKEPPNSILTWDDLINKFAWDRFKKMLRACPHHGFSKLTQIDTFYNGLTEQDQDPLNAASGVNLLNKTTREALKIIENKSKVRYSRSKSNVSRVNTNSRDVVSKTDDQIDKLADQILNLVEIVNKQVIASAKAVEKTCVTYGGAHAYYDCIATDSNQPSVCAATGSYNQVSLPNRVSHQIPPPGFDPGEMKAVTTRIGLAYEGPSIPTNSPLEKVDKQNTNEILDKEHSNSSGSTAQVQPLVVPISIPEPDVLRTQKKPTIPYPSSFADALLLRPKFASTIKSLLANKDKLFKLAKVLLKENCSAMLLKKLLEKLGDPADPRVPLILGRSFLRTDRALIDVYGEEITLRDVLDFQYNRKSSSPTLVSDDSISEIDSCKEPIVKSSSPTLTPFRESDFFSEEIENFLKDDSIPMEIENSVFDPEGDILFIEKFADQRRVNPKIHDVIKKEAIKLLDAVDVIAKIPHPTTVKGVRSFLGHAGFYHRFIQDFSKIDRPMTHLLEKETPFVFSKECIDAFDNLKKKLTEAPILVVPDWNLPFELMCDESDYANAVDYLSKWVEAKSLPTNDARVVVKFLKSIFSRFGIPRAIISDHGTYFCNDQFTRVMIKYGVTHRLATAYHPQTSGQVEVSNHGLKRILEMMMGGKPCLVVNGHRVKHYFGGDIPSNVALDLHALLKGQGSLGRNKTPGPWSARVLMWQLFKGLGVNNIEAGVPFFIFPRFVKLLIDHQLGDMSHHKHIYDNPSLTKKVFANMKMISTSFSRVVTPLFDNMLVPAAKDVEKIEKLEGRVDSFGKGEIIQTGEDNSIIDEDVEINLEEAQPKPYRMDIENPEKVLSMQVVDDEEPA
uniref:Reverse transcriptase domain-containing protein n=1 Tax=Tanacetum cinerariifolium TaxID=118510 RepID=A0A6L2P3F1_TANCI|nr:reverse transcriptase domain-containing protein [Tanacetum cinerariifolium]